MQDATRSRFPKKKKLGSLMEKVSRAHGMGIQKNKDDIYAKLDGKKKGQPVLLIPIWDYACNY